MRKVAIVARAGTAALAPWRDTSWEIWGIPCLRYPRVDRLFEIHADDVSRKDAAHIVRDDAWRELAFPMYDDVPLYCDPSRMHLSPSTVEYPLAEIEANFPRKYLENSIAYMVALAIHEGCDELGLWGVHMTGRAQFEYELPSVAYWTGFAEGRGVKVTIPPGSPLLMSTWEAGRYGVNDRRRYTLPTMGSVNY